MANKPPVGTGRALVPSDRARSAIVRRLNSQMGTLTTAVIASIEREHPWFRELSAEERSWITLVARAGVDGFVQWFADDAAEDVDPRNIFNAATKALTRKITLDQTVDLVRTTIATIEELIQVVTPRGDRPPLQTAIVYYSREIAFATAAVYAKAAETRGAWDERTETLVIDSIMRSDNPDYILSRASTLGWPAESPQTIVIGALPAKVSAQAAVEGTRSLAERLSLNALAAVQGNRLVCLVAGDSLAEAKSPLDIVEKLDPAFGAGHVVVGPLVSGLENASQSAKAAISGMQAASAWKEGPRIVSARDLLPERVLAGNKQAHRELVKDVYQPLLEAGGDLLLTAVSFLDHGCSVEATARTLYVHANTVRYRLKRIWDVTGYSPTDPRDAYILRLAITLGRLQAE